MEKDWQLIYEVHHIVFGILFLALSAATLHAMIRIKNTSFFMKPQLSYAIHSLFVIFTSNRALVLLWQGFVNDEIVVRRAFDFEKFLFNIGFPCLIAGLAAYSRAVFACMDHLEGRAQLVFHVVLTQCYLYITAEIVETMVANDQPVSLLIHFVLTVTSFLCVLRGIFVYARPSSSGVSDGEKKLNFQSVEIVGESNCKMKADDIGRKRVGNKEMIVSVLILCIWIVYGVFKSCIKTELMKKWNDNMDGKSWFALMAVSVLRMLELCNAAVMSNLATRHA